MDNITATPKGYVIENRGKKIKIAGYVVTGNIDGDPINQWHQKGAEGVSLNVREVAEQFDLAHRFQHWYQPISIENRGKRYRTDQSFIIRQDDPDFDEPIIFGDPVKTGKLTDEEWKALNPDVSDNKWTKSEHHELINYDVAADLFAKHCRGEFGETPMVTSMGLLGEHGGDGLFITTKLPKWDDRIADQLGTAVREYFTVWISPQNMMYAFNTSIVALCQNTLSWGLNNASHQVRFGHHKGATGDYIRAMKMVYGQAMTAREEAQGLALKMVDVPMNPDRFKVLLEGVYPDPLEIDTDRLTLSTDEQRKKLRERKLAKSEAYRAAAVEIFTNEQFHEKAGITDQTKGSSFAAWQAITYMESHRQIRNAESRWTSLANGDRNLNIRRGFDVVMMNVNENYVPSKVPEARVELLRQMLETV